MKISELILNFGLVCSASVECSNGEIYYEYSLPNKSFLIVSVGEKYQLYGRDDDGCFGIVNPDLTPEQFLNAMHLFCIKPNKEIVLTEEIIRQYFYKKDESDTYYFALSNNIYIEEINKRYSLWIRNLKGNLTRVNSNITLEQFEQLVNLMKIPKCTRYAPFTYNSWVTAGRPNPCVDNLEYTVTCVNTTNDCIKFDGRWAYLSSLFNSQYKLPNGKPFGACD